MSTGTFFGKRWDAPAFDYATEVDTPVGQECGYCFELIEGGDSGSMEVFVDANEHAQVKPAHIECLLRATLGSPAHLNMECTCTGHAPPTDPRSWREQGRAVMDIIQNRQGFFRL